MRRSRIIDGPPDQGDNPAEFRFKKESLEELQGEFQDRLLMLRGVVLNPKLSANEKVNPASSLHGQAQGIRDGMRRAADPASRTDSLIVDNSRGWDKMSGSFIAALRKKKSSPETTGPLTLRTPKTHDQEEIINAETKDKRVRFEKWEQFLLNSLIEPVRDYIIDSVEKSENGIRMSSFLRQPMVRCQAVLGYLRKNLGEENQYLLTRYYSLKGQVALLEKYVEKATEF